MIESILTEFLSAIFAAGIVGFWAAQLGHQARREVTEIIHQQLLQQALIEYDGAVDRVLMTGGAKLGHAEVTTTARHYARWVGGDEYAEPVRPLPGELPADLLARIAPEKSPQSPHTTRSGVTSPEVGHSEAVDNPGEKGVPGGGGGWTRTSDLRLMKPPL